MGSKFHKINEIDQGDNPISGGQEMVPKWATFISKLCTRVRRRSSKRKPFLAMNGKGVEVGRATDQLWQSIASITPIIHQSIPFLSQCLMLFATENYSKQVIQPNDLHNQFTSNMLLTKMLAKQC